MAGWVVVRVTVTKSTGERNKWQDMSLKVSQFYFAYCNIQLTKTFLFCYPGLPESVFSDSRPFGLASL